MYCVYLTTYKGNKLPPFYIGSTSIEKIQNGYNGSVCSKNYGEIWNKERRENPGLFSTKIICTQETWEESLNREFEIQNKLNVVLNPLYANKAIYKDGKFFCSFSKEELKKRGEKSAKARIGSKRSLESRKRMSEAAKCRKRTKFSVELRKKLSEAAKGKKMSKEAKQKMSLAKKGKPTHNTGKKTYNNGITQKYFFVGAQENGFVLGKLKVGKPNVI